MAASNGSLNGGSEGRRGGHYLQLLTETTSEIHSKVQEYQKILNDDQSSIDLLDGGDSGTGTVDGDTAGGLNEEMRGRLRSAIGKATLLVDKKFVQFRELCNKNLSEDENAPFRTLNEDLAGFWDLVDIQISDVRETFAEMDQLKGNNWQPTKEHIPDLVKHPRKVVERSALESSTSSHNIAASAARGTNGAGNGKEDEERRRRLREAKQRAAQMKAATAGLEDDAPVTIFVAGQGPVNNGS